MPALSAERKERGNEKKLQKFLPPHKLLLQTLYAEDGVKDFKSFSSESENNGKDMRYDKEFENDKGVNLIKDVSAKMQGRSQNDIMRAIIEEAERGKRAGTLTNEDIDNFYNLMAPTLDGFKKQKLKSIIARLKRI